MNVPRILEIATMLEKRELPPGYGFDMHNFVRATQKIAKDEDLYDIPELVFLKEGDLTADRAVALNCHTAACIAGHVVIKYRPDINPFNHFTKFMDIAEEELGLTEEQSSKLFVPVEFVCDWNTITPERAARVLRHLAATGEVDWSV